MKKVINKVIFCDVTGSEAEFSASFINVIDNQYALFNSIDCAEAGMGDGKESMEKSRVFYEKSG